MTLRDAADAAVARGELCGTYDYALPQRWVDAVHRRTGIWPQSVGIVWSYPDEGYGSVFGVPFALTAAGRALLARLAGNIWEGPLTED